MMKPIRIFRHVACEEPGYLGTFLDKKKVPWELVCVDEQHPVPQRLDDISGLIFMGGSGSVNRSLNWIVDELALIKQAFKDDVPMMGICFGGQLMAKALGGKVTKGAGMEIGWHALQRVNGEDGHGWLDALPENFSTFHWHEYEFEIPAGCTSLLQSQCFRHQAFSKGNHLAMQFHLEMTEAMVKGWIHHYGSDVEKPTRCTQSADVILSHLNDKISQLHHVADCLYGAWLQRVLSRQ